MLLQNDSESFSSGRESAVSFGPLEHFKLSYVFLFRLFGGRGGTIFLII